MTAGEEDYVNERVSLVRPWTIRTEIVSVLKSQVAPDSISAGFGSSVKRKQEGVR